MTNNAAVCFGLAPAVGAAVGGTHRCVLLSTHQVDCEGWTRYVGSSGETADWTQANAAAIAAGSYLTCVLTTEGNVDCYGDPYSKGSYTGGDAVAVDTSHYEWCVILRSTQVRCTDFGQTRMLPGTGAVQVAVGGGHVCMLKTTGNVECDGWSQEGQAEGHQGGDAIGVSSGWTHSCALLRDGTVDCWGSNSYGQGSDYTSLRFGRALQLSSGPFHNCALLEGEKVYCWGSGGYSLGLVGVPFLVPGVVSIDAGGDAAVCAVLQSGDVECLGCLAWSATPDYVWSRGRDLPPALPPTQEGHCALL